MKPENSNGNGIKIEENESFGFKHPDSFYENLTDFEKMIWRLMKANKGVVNLVSPPGFGKTAFVTAFSKKIEKCCIPLHLTSYEDVDVAGLPSQSKHGKINVMKYDPPEWAVIANECEGGAVLLFDEANRCKPAVMNATLRILNEKSIGYDFIFNDDVYFILTGNIGSFGKYSDGAETNVFDSAMYGRLYTINLLDYAQMWQEHWFQEVGNHLCKPLLSYLRANPHMLFEYNEGSEDPAFPSYRSNTNLHYHLVANLGKDNANNISKVLSLKEDFASIIGVAAGAKFASYLEDMNKINGLEVLNNYKKHADVIKEYQKSRHQELLDDMKNFKFEHITKKQSDNLRDYLTFLTDVMGYDDTVAGMIDYILNYDMPDYENKEPDRELEHINKMTKFNFSNESLSKIANQLRIQFPFLLEE